MWNWSRSDDGSVWCEVASEIETNQIGLRLAEHLTAGDCVALIGDLGAGKTRLVKAIAEGFGVLPDEVNSPTFTLIQEYAGRLLLRHCDAYRLRNAEEFADLGLDELFAPDGVALIEWADRVEEYLPRDRLEIRFRIDSPAARGLHLSATGRHSQGILDQLKG